MPQPCASPTTTVALRPPSLILPAAEHKSCFGHLSHPRLALFYLSSLPPPCLTISNQAAGTFPLSSSTVNAVRTPPGTPPELHPDLAPVSRLRACRECVLTILVRLQVCLNPAAPDICSLGEGLRYDLIRPVLESCTPDSLLRFEQNDPVRYVIRVLAQHCR